ncbi:SDR family NAD(P)-dependent oxidoreductase [Dyella caseinilytica]|uniref:SDR family NAD(P)-dependent oxidoreductase n=1 Tax=Dyella caseinilytica TaxID=1849581 RepID=A0ABX7GUW0_9GAMM|nr:SDR family NAD(P)-dependent oxidoreductase [Dyella caseinilytica]QRN53664.1 SDR family NAD(P)-dependent oxidoreductase [Dyella caseinilytica]GFZ88314.1 short-chain dehydrogenase/reductase [Dyella caseinilytica]
MSKIWLITGSARGLGRHLAEAVLAGGHRLVATARQTDKLQDLVDRYGDRIRTFALDVTDASAAQAAIDVAVSAFGRLDVLVNNAGFGHIAPFEQAAAEDFRAQIDTNFYGVVNLTRAALPVMRKQRSGHIFQISSVGGRLGMPGLSAYQAAKWAVGGFTEVLAKEAAPFGVKVTSVEPGGMRTGWGEIARGAIPDLLPDYEPSVGTISRMLSGHIGQEAGDPDKVAQVLLQLADHDATPEHLLLGSDAVHFFHLADEARRAEAERWRAVSLSTDVDSGVTLPEISLAREPMP